jgi:hypothetical protein
VIRQFLEQVLLPASIEAGEHHPFPSKAWKSIFPHTVLIDDFDVVSETCEVWKRQLPFLASLVFGETDITIETLQESHRDTIRREILLHQMKQRRYLVQILDSEVDKTTDQNGGKPETCKEAEDLNPLDAFDHLDEQVLVEEDPTCIARLSSPAAIFKGKGIYRHSARLAVYPQIWDLYGRDMENRLLNLSYLRSLSADRTRSRIVQGLIDHIGLDSIKATIPEYMNSSDQGARHWSVYAEGEAVFRCDSCPLHLQERRTWQALVGSIII